MLFDFDILILWTFEFLKSSTKMNIKLLTNIFIVKNTKKKFLIDTYYYKEY